jgi:hypothetical protein
LSEYVIPKKSLHGKLVNLLTTGLDDAEKEEYRVMGFPCVLTDEGGRYKRNEYMWNLCFVFSAGSSVMAFEPVVRKCGRILRSAEVSSRDKGWADDRSILDTSRRPVLTIHLSLRYSNSFLRILTRIPRRAYPWMGSIAWN